MHGILDIARWQFGITTVYHFIFVPLTIGLSALVAVMETFWLRTKNQEWMRLAGFFGKLFLINFAIGVVTGIVQEFQFGMNWAGYSRFVGDIFGAPLACEALISFFLESTFIGLWIFGRDRLPRALHLACIWVVHIGTLISAWFILSANSWMQHPVGYRIDPKTHRAVLTDFWAVMFNKVQLVTFPHVVTAAYMTGAVFLLGVCAWQYARQGRAGAESDDRETYRLGLRLGAVVAIVAFGAIAISGDTQGKIMTEVQPMKMASAEALYNTSDTCAPFSIFTIGTPSQTRARFEIKVPCLLSFLATGHFDRRVQGIDQLRTEYEHKYGGNPKSRTYSSTYTPIIPVTYWTFRWMMGLGAWAAGGAVLILWFTRRGRMPRSRLFSWGSVTLPLFVLGGNSVGWVFTEMGRQPWVVFGLLTTRNGVSPGVDQGSAWISVVSLTLLYGVLAVVEGGLMVKYIRQGIGEFVEPPDPSLRSSQVDDDAPLTFSY